MGQTLDLTSSATKQDAKEEKTTEEQHEEMRNQRKERQQELQTRLASMSIRELLYSVLEAQSERVATYREFDK